MPKLDFIPARDGFHFANLFVTTVFDWAGIQIKPGGLCGGMAAGSTDYYGSGLPIPACLPSAFPDGVVPAEGKSPPQIHL